MLNLSNVLSFSRAGFALLFLLSNPILRIAAVIAAMLTDVLDGFIARRKGITSPFGAILDPIMDKFFVFFAVGMLFAEKKMLLWEIAMVLSRDLALCFFGLYLLMVRGWKDYECRSIFWGKTTTALQFCILVILSLGYQFSPKVYGIFVITGLGAFIELVKGFQAKVPTKI